MSEKDIKTKPQTTTKAVKNAPKSVEHSAKQAAWDIKTVAKDTLVKNAIDKQLDTKHSEQPQRAEVEATEQVESTYYSAVDTVYQKGKHFAENKLKQHRQQVKTRQNQNADTPHTPQNGNISEVRNTPKQPNNALKTRVNTSVSSAPTPKTKEQIAKWSRISWSSTQTGDLSFYGDLSHVGIVAGMDAGGKDAAGNILVINSSSGGNNVVITTNSGFGFAARPRCY